MLSGTMRKRITFQARSVSQDSFGAQVPVWTDVITMWAEVAPASGRELQAAAAVNQELTHTITTRWPGASVTITPAHRAVMKNNGRVFDIKSVINVDERNHTQMVQAVELLTQG